MLQITPFSNKDRFVNPITKLCKTKRVIPQSKRNAPLKSNSTVVFCVFIYSSEFSLVNIANVISFYFILFRSSIFMKTHFYTLPIKVSFLRIVVQYDLLFENERSKTKKAVLLRQPFLIVLDKLFYLIEKL